MPKYYHLKVKEVVKETEDVISIHFWHPWNELYVYKPGQYLTILWTSPEGESIRRSYSLSSSPYTDVTPAITVKRVDDGPVSNFLYSQVKEGDVLEVMQPMGTFVLEPDPELSRKIFLLGTGSGITPLISIAKSVLMVEHESQVTLIYGNRSYEDIIFRKTLDHLKEKYKDKLRLIYALTQPPQNWTGEVGRLTPSKIGSILQPYEKEIREEGSLFFLCGQPEFMEGAEDILRQMGAPPVAIRHENFYTTPSTELIEAQEEMDTSRKSRTVELHYEGEVHHVEVQPHESILEAALKNDIDLPYSCQAGSCTSCMGRLKKGEVVMDTDDGLTEAELNEGFILNCVAHPLTDDVVIEVD